MAAYALGSLAHGGFSELVSDIDLGLILSDPPRPDDAEVIQAVAEAEKRQGSRLRQRLSVFWGTPTTLRGMRDGGRFPALDRLDLIENGRLLLGSDAREGLSRPTADELLIAGAEFALDYLAGLRSDPQAAQNLASMRRAGADSAEKIRSPQVLLGLGVRELTKFVLFPVRFLFSARTGRVGTNHDAVSDYLEDANAPSRTLVKSALAWRTVPPADQAATVELLGNEMLPLYLHYVDDHIQRLDGLGEHELASEFRQWRDRLIG
ncbi:MAG TPA: hypothetical protein VLU92_08595 [Candidatus Dormibacteraeota bacterium]|nr:hypothetical protein [Candidatus Dormibacteraeota bacterium]